jgi:hypothetical protein
MYGFTNVRALGYKCTDSLVVCISVFVQSDSGLTRHTYTYTYTYTERAVRVFFGIPFSFLTADIRRGRRGRRGLGGPARMHAPNPPIIVYHVLYLSADLPARIAYIHLQLGVRVHIWCVVLHSCPLCDCVYLSRYVCMCMSLRRRAAKNILLTSS